MQRERPLQSSMILPQTGHNVNRRPSIPIDYNFPMHAIKKIPTNNGDSHIIQHHNMMMQQARQFVTQGNFEEVPLIPRTNDPFHQIFERLEKLTRIVDKHDLQLGSLLQEGELSRRVLHDFKKTIPLFNTNTDITDQLFSLKLEIKDLHQELSKTPKAHELEQSIKKIVEASAIKLNQSSASNSTVLSNSSSSKNTDLDLVNEMIRKRDEHYQNIFSNFETQISMVKRNLGNMNLQMKVSPITSSSCILVKYQELFKAKSKHQSDMIVNEYTYYIDSEGCLLDCHSRYIVDQKGKKVKLQEKHINILKQQKILQ